MTKRLEPSSYVNDFNISGRWVPSSSGSLTASWAGSSISFVFFGKFLGILSGLNTERKASWNGGVPMLALSAGPNEVAVVCNPSLSKTCDLGPGQVATVFDCGDGEARKVYVRIMLVDWAIRFELGALVTDEDASILSPPKATPGRILYIGDSISCGFYVQSDHQSSDGQPPNGCLDAFPYVAQRLLAQENPPKVFNVDLISYPGWTLVAPDEQEKERGNPLGMEDKFFQVSPWSTDLYAYTQSQAEVTAVVIELGTNDQEYYSVERFKSSLHNFVSKLLKTMTSPPRFIWMIPPFPDGEEESILQGEFEGLVSSLQAEFGGQTIIQLCDISSDFRGVDTIDGLHPSPAGHKTLGSRMAEVIKACLIDNC